jgi:hypothetical protein
MARAWRKPAKFQFRDLHILWFVGSRLGAGAGSENHISRRQMMSSAEDKSGLITVFADLKNGQESLLRDIDATNALHSFFACLLLFQELTFA